MQSMYVKYKYGFFCMMQNSKYNYDPLNNKSSTFTYKET